MEYLLDAESLLEEFERYKGYRHPILLQIKERIAFLKNLPIGSTAVDNTLT